MSLPPRVHRKQKRPIQELSEPHHPRSAPEAGNVSAMHAVRTYLIVSDNWKAKPVIEREVWLAKGREGREEYT